MTVPELGQWLSMRGLLLAVKPGSGAQRWEVVLSPSVVLETAESDERGTTHIFDTDFEKCLTLAMVAWDETFGEGARAS